MVLLRNVGHFKVIKMIMVRGEHFELLHPFLKL